MSQMDNEFLIDLGDPTASPAVRGLRRQELTRSSDLPFFHAAATSEAVDKLAAPQTNRERFRRKFFVVVLRTLNRACAVAGGPQRDEILTELQTHLSARIEDKVIAYFLADNSILPGNAFGNRHYYELAAEGFAERPDLFAHWNMEGIQSSLRSNDTFHAVFAMLFHQWVFVEGMAEVKSLNLLLSGAAQLFKSDLDSSAFVYRSIYQMIRKALSNHLCWNESVKARLMSLWELWARFAFFYEKQVAYVVYNFHHFQLQQLLEGAKERSTMLVVRKSDYQNPGLNSAFVRFVMDQLLAVKNERVFRRYMHFTGHVFSKMTLTAESAVLLHSELYSRSKQGNPYYLPDECRRSCQAALAMVFPRGQFMRQLVSLTFRLFQPYYSARHLLAFFWLIVVRCCGPCSRKKQQ